MLSVDVEISSDSSPVTHQNDKGAFKTPVSNPGTSADTPLTLIVKLDLLNALCHAVWKTGVLNINPILPESVTDIVGSVRVDAQLPPLISLEGESGNLFELTIAELRLEVTPKGSEISDLVVPNRARFTDVDGGFITLVIEGMPSVRADTLVKESDSPINERVIESLC